MLVGWVDVVGEEEQRKGRKTAGREEERKKGKKGIKRHFL